MAPLYWWVQPTVTAGVGLVAFIVAIVTICSNRRMARLKATVDFIEGTESKEYYQKRYAAFLQYRKDSAYRDCALDTRDDPAREAKRDLCLDFLNHYELGAIACKKGIIDRSFFEFWYRPALVRDWNEGSHLVRAARSPKKPGDRGGKETFSEFEALAVKWGATRLQ